MSKFKFTPEMFFKNQHADHIDIYEAASLAQAALDKHIESLPAVFVKYSRKQWWASQEPLLDDTHTAVLFNLEPIEKAECEHEELCQLSYTGKWSAVWGICKTCGVKLKATWEVVK